MHRALSKGWTLVMVLVTLTALPTAGWAAERCVLGEYFNATW